MLSNALHAGTTELHLVKSSDLHQTTIGVPAGSSNPELPSAFRETETETETETER